MMWSQSKILTTSFLLTLVGGTLMMSCSSTPEPQPEPSQQEIRQDADRFFQKMDREERK